MTDARSARLNMNKMMLQKLHHTPNMYSYNTKLDMQKISENAYTVMKNILSDINYIFLHEPYTRTKLHGTDSSFIR
jgi:hypothetical protein